MAGLLYGHRNKRGGGGLGYISRGITADELEYNYRRYGNTPPPPSELALQRESVGKRIANAQMRISDAGEPIPEYKPKSNKLWEGIMWGLDMLDRPRNAVVNALQDVGAKENSFRQGFMEGLTGKETAHGADLLKMSGVKNKYAQGIGGFVVDILLDPVNLVEFGLGSLAKGVITGTGKTLSREAAEAALKAGAVDVGDMLLKSVPDIVELAKQSKKSTDFVNLMSKALPSRIDDIKSLHNLWRVVNKGDEMTDALRRTLYSLSPDKSALIDAVVEASKYGNKGLKVAGKELVSGARMQDIGAGIHKGIGAVVDAIPGGKAVKKVTGALDRGIRNMFSPKGAGLLDLGEAGELVYEWQRAAKGMKSAGIDNELRNLFEIVQPIVGNDDSLTKVRNALENSKKYAHTLTPEETQVFKALSDLRSKWGLTEQELGVLSDMVKVVGDTDYVPRVANWDTRGAVMRGGKTKQFNVTNWHNFARKHEGTIDEINRKLYNLDPEKYGEKFLETNIVKIFVDRAVDHHTVVADKRFIDRVLKGFGKRVTGASMVDEGHTIVVPRQSFKVYKLNRGMDNAVDAAFKRGGTVIKDGVEISKLVDDDIRSAVRKIISVDPDSLTTPPLVELTKDQVEALGVAINDLEAYALPKAMVDYINSSAKKQVDEGISTLKGVIDRFYKLWKPTVTGMNPGYHMRNVLGATWNNILDVGFDALDPKIQAYAIDLLNPKKNGTVKLGGKKYSYNAIRKAMQENNVLTTFMRTDTTSLKEMVERQTRAGLGELSNVKGWAGKLWHGGQALGGKIEEQVRAVNFLAHLKRGADFKQAAAQAVKYHFDYTELSKTEAEVIRRIIPFYTWFRKNFPLQLEELLNNPAMFNKPRQLQANMATALGADMSNLPDWMEEQIPIPISRDEETGRDRYITASLPYADLANITGQGFMGMLSPLIKIPVELYTGQSLLTGAPIQSYEGQKKTFMGTDMDAKLAHALSQFGIARDISNAVADQQPSETTPVSPRRGLRDWTFGLTRDYSPEAGELSMMYDYSRQLENVIQRLKDLGVEVRDVNDIKKRKNKWIYQAAE